MKLAFIDLETTGLDEQRHGIVQIAGMLVVNGEEKERFNWSVALFADDVIEDHALAVTGLTREQIATFEAAALVYRTKLIPMLGRYVDKFSRADKFHFVGYNANFDVRFLRRFFEKNHDKYFGSWFWFPPIDVMGLAAHRLAGVRHTLPDFKLGTVAEHLQVKVDGALHDASVDIALTRAMYDFLCQPVQEVA